MNNGLWGHALFLASKMGERDYGQVMARFANGLAFNHPLQTLYQIMSGRQPSSVTVRIPAPACICYTYAYVLFLLKYLKLPVSISNVMTLVRIENTTNVRHVFWNLELW